MSEQQHPERQVLSPIHESRSVLGTTTGPSFGTRLYVPTIGYVESHQGRYRVVTVTDRPLTGSEAVILYEQKIQELREGAERGHRLQAHLLEVLRAHGGRASLVELMQEADLGVNDLLPLLTDLMEDGRVLGQGSMVVLTQSPQSSP